MNPSLFSTNYSLSHERVVTFVMSRTQDLFKKNNFVDCGISSMKKKKKKKKTTLWTLKFLAFLTHTIYLYGSLEPTSPGGSWITTTE